MTRSSPGAGQPVVLLAGPILVRTLGLAGIPVIVAATEPSAPAFASRYCRGRELLEAGADRAGLPAALLALGDRLLERFGGRLPLMYGDDFWLELIGRHREALQQRFQFLLPEPRLLDALLDKDRFQELAGALDLPVPRRLAWDELAGSSGAVLAKPRSKSTWHDSMLRQHLFRGDSKALLLRNGAAARTDPLLHQYRDQLLFQQYIAGDDRQLWSYHGFSDERGAVLAGFVGRKLRTWPPTTGESSFIELLHDPARAARGRELAGRLCLAGPFKLDLKTDPETGRDWLLEVNPRFNLWHYLGAVNGVNLMQVAYQYLLHGERPTPRDCATHTRWLYLAKDCRAARTLAARGELSLAGWLASLAAGRTVYNAFAWSDPAPLLVAGLNRLRRRARRLFRHRVQ